MVRTSATLLHCSHHVLTSSVHYQSTNARQNGIYLLIITVDASMFNTYPLGIWFWSLIIFASMTGQKLEKKSANSLAVVCN